MTRKIDSEYQDFLQSAEIAPPVSISKMIASGVRRDLHISSYRVFSKLIGIHFVTALATLSVCPQFGFKFFGEGMGLMHYFMALGPYGCLVTCGAFFMGTSLVVAGLILRGEELRAIRRSRVLQLGALTLLSLGFFIMLDAQIVFGLALAWFFGAWVGSLLTLEITWRLRFKEI